MPVLFDRKNNDRKDPTLRESRTFKKAGFVSATFICSLAIFLTYMFTTLIFNLLEILIVNTKLFGFNSIGRYFLYDITHIASFFQNVHNYSPKHLQQFGQFINYAGYMRWGLFSIIFLLVGYVYLKKVILPLRLNNNEYGDAKLGLPKDIKKQTLAIPDRYEEFDGELGTIVYHEFNRNGRMNYEVKTELDSLEKTLGFNDERLDEDTKKKAPLIIFITSIVLIIIAIFVLKLIYNLIF